MGEFGSVAMCKRIYKEQTSEQGDVPFFKIGTFGADPDAFISNELFEDFKRTYPYPAPGTLLISAAGSIGRIVEYQGEKAYFQDSNIVWLEHDHRLNDAFFKPLYSQIEWGLEGSTIKRLYNKDLLSAEVTIPDDREQKVIGQFFAKLDNLITLHQRERGKAPFSWSFAWEQRKLGDCFDFLHNNTLSRADLNSESGSARNIHYGDILIKFGDCLGLDSGKLPFADDESILSKYANSTLRIGDVIFADTAEDESAGKCVELVKLPNEPVISGLHTIPARPKFPFGSGYLGHYLNAPAYHDQLLPLMQGIKVVSISKTALQDTQICFPTALEQSAIGTSLNALDSLITLHQ